MKHTVQELGYASGNKMFSTVVSGEHSRNAMSGVFKASDVITTVSHVHTALLCSKLFLHFKVHGERPGGRQAGRQRSLWKKSAVAGIL